MQFRPILVINTVLNKHLTLLATIYCFFKVLFHLQMTKICTSAVLHLVLPSNKCHAKKSKKYFNFLFKYFVELQNWTAMCMSKESSCFGRRLSSVCSSLSLYLLKGTWNFLPCFLGSSRQFWMFSLSYYKIDVEYIDVMITNLISFGKFQLPLHLQLNFMDHYVQYM